MKSSELRKQFLDYFKSKEHKIIDSSPLVPMGDPSLLFTTAGMVQFKPMFAGEVDLKYTRATSCQKCMRTTDLENVGQTPRHHTFFEMLGNFSFGDYFKKESIEFAWEFSTEIIKLDPKKIYASVYQDDDEAFELWEKHIGIPKDRIVRLGKEDNFWGPAGDSGACGPCSELYYDLGEDMLKPGDDPSVGGENNRYIEYWNLVFNQFNQLKSGELEPLPQTGIDTGMGLERLAIISQGVKSVYDTDLFKPFIQKIVEITKTPYKKETSVPYQVIADHIRAITFVLAENVLPSNEGRGYVIRRILRRAMRYGQSIGLQEAFLNKLVPIVADIMGDAYPDINNRQDKIAGIIYSEEEAFLSTLKDGSQYLENIIHQAKDQKKKVISGEQAFKLYDSMGFPIDITLDIARENKMTVDIEKYEQLMDEQKERGKSAGGSETQLLPETILEKKLKTTYTGEDKIEDHSKILYLFQLDENKRLNEAKSVKEGDNIVIITESTPFYGESGGQVGDTGIITAKNAEIQIEDAKKEQNLILHYGTVKKGLLEVGDTVQLKVESDKKSSTARNHSATHILQKVLQEEFGDHIRQLGSLVTEEKLRFDFSHFNPLSAEEINSVEQKVNKMIRENHNAEVQLLDKEKALKAGAMAFFGDKYDQEVRTVKIGSSFELCGGTHVKRSGDIGCFKIVSESSISSGTRRIEAVTGEKAIEIFSDNFNKLRSLEQLLNTHSLEEKINQLIEKNKTLEKEIKQVKMKQSVSNIGDTIKENLFDINGIQFVAFSVEDNDIEELRKINDEIKSRYSEKLVTFLVSKIDDKVFYLSTLSKDLKNSKVKANDIIKKASEFLDGKGGGKPDRAQGSGSNANNIPKAIEEVKSYVESIA